MTHMMKILINCLLTMNNQRVEELKQNIRAEYPQTRVEYIGEVPLSEDQLIEQARDVDVLVSGFQDINDRVYQALHLRAYCVSGIGYARTRPEEATNNAVVVTNAAGYSTDEVANHTVALILACQRKFHLMFPWTRTGNWDFGVMRPTRRFSTCTIGMFGFGQIARSAARQLSGFDVTIIACDPYVDENIARSHGVRLVEFDELLETADFLSIHAPQMPSTNNIFNEAALRKMKPTAFIINTARGSLIDHQAFYLALKEGWIAGAALDVVAHHPPDDDYDRKIISLPNVMTTAHAGFYSEEAIDDLIHIVSTNVGAVLRGEVPPDIVNKDVVSSLTWVSK